MRRASRDYTKYLRGSEEMGGGGSGAPHEGPLHAPPPSAPSAPSAPPPAAAASRSTFVALLGLGLGQVVCSVALFLYFRAQVSARFQGPRPGAPLLPPALVGRRIWPPGCAPQMLHTREEKRDSEEEASRSWTAQRGAGRARRWAPRTHQASQRSGWARWSWCG